MNIRFCNGRIVMISFIFAMIIMNHQTATSAIKLPLTGAYGETILSVGKLNDSDYSADSRYVVTCHSVGAFVWDADTGEALYWLDRNVNVSRIVFSPDCKHLYTQRDNTKVWDLQTLKAERIYEASGPISFSSDGRLLLINERLWNAETGDLIRVFPHPDKIVDAVLSPDGKLALTLTSRFEFINYPEQTDTVRLWDVDAGQVIGSRTYAMDISSQAYTIDEIAFSPDGKYMLVSSNDAVRGFADVISVETGEKIHTFWSNGYEIFLPEGEGLLLRRYDYPASLWDLETGEIIRPVPISLRHDSIKISADGKRILLDNNLVDLETGDVIQRYAFFDFDMEGSIFISFTPADESLLFLVWGDESAYLMNVENGSIIHRFQHDGLSVTAASLDVFCKFLLLWGDGFTVWDLETGQLLRSHENERATTDAVAVSSDGKYVMVGNRSLYDAVSGTKIESILFPSGFYDVAFSPDSRYVLTSKESVDLWDLKTGALVRTFLSSELVHEIAYSPNGKTILTGFGGNTIEWDVESGERIATIPHEGWPGEIKYSKSGEIFGIQTLGTHLRIYAAENGEFIGEFSSKYPIASYDFSEDGNQLVVGGGDGTIRVWDISGIYREASGFRYFDCYE